VRAMKTRIAALGVICVFLTGCAFVPSVKNKLSVRPVKYVPCLENMAASTSCGSVTVPPDEAEGFVVIVGWKRYEEITESAGQKKLIQEQMHKKFHDFATSEVVSRDYCHLASVPRDKQNIMRWEGSGDRGIYVVCTE